MQIFDSLLIVILLVFIISRYIFGSKQSIWFVYLPLIALVLSLLQLAIEGYRWQVVPAYGVMILSLIYFFRSFITNRRQCNQSSNKSRWLTIKRTLIVVIALLTLLSSTLFSYFFPIFEFPTPKGTYTVGTSEFHLIDETRLETYTSNPDDKRELMVRVWYPADADSISDKTPVPYWRYAAIRSAELVKSMGLPHFLFNYLDKVSTNSFWQVPVSDLQSDYPVLIFSHGFGQGNAAQNTHLMESLASHGYIVFGIDHSYVGMASIFPDGRVARLSEDSFAGLLKPSAEMLSMYEELQTTTDWKKQVELLKRAEEVGGNTQVMSEALAIWELDQLFVLSELEKLNLGSKNIINAASSNTFTLTGRLGLSRLGFFGMSFGGMTSFGNCVKDSRCKAGLNMDGFMTIQEDLPAIKRPFMFMAAEGMGMFNSMFEIAQDDTYLVTIEGSEHINFSDFSIISPLYKLLGVNGLIDGNKMLTITDDYVRAFFDKHLKGKEPLLLSSATNKYPEVQLKTKVKSTSVSRMGAGAAAKLACSGVYLQGRKPEDVIERDLTFLMNPLLKNTQYTFNQKQQTATATMPDNVSRTALYRPGVGCTLMLASEPKHLLEQAKGITEFKREQRPQPWPVGDRVTLDRTDHSIDWQQLDQAIDNAFTEPEDKSKIIDTRAVIVVHNGQIIAERYADGFDSHSRFLSWSASKSVASALIGTMVTDGKLNLNQQGLVHEWALESDPRYEITLDHLLTMTSGIDFVEHPYGPSVDSTVMLFERENMGTYAANHLLAESPGEIWSYSSGTTNLLSRILYEQAGGNLKAVHDYAWQRFFEPVGMTSAIFEPDAFGAHVGSSFFYATAQDWARFGLLFLNEGRSGEQQILSKDWVEYTHTPTPLAPQGRYGAQFWLNAGHPKHDEGLMMPDLPKDTYMAAGFQDQWIAIVPSKNAVVIRLGWTMGTRFDTNKHFSEILASLPSN